MSDISHLSLKETPFNQAVINKAMEWLIVGNKGLSSTALLSNILSNGKTGAIDSVNATFHPHDPADLRRCIGLLDFIPELRPHLHIMRDVSTEWAALVDQWETLENSLKNEIKSSPHRAPMTYDLMKQIIKTKLPK